MTPVEEVGTGVGYFWTLFLPFGDSRATRLAGRGREGDEDTSKAGSSDGAGAGRLTPATGDT